MKKKVIVFSGVLLVILCGYISIVYFLTPANLTLLSSSLEMTSYKNVETNLNDMIEDTTITIINGNNEYEFSLDDLGYSLNKDYEECIKGYDNIINRNFGEADITSELILLDEDSMLSNLQIINNESELQASDAQIIYQDKEYVIIPEVISDSIDLELAKEEINKNILTGEFEIDVTELKKTPEVYSDDLTDKVENLNNYIDSKAVVNFDDETKTLTKDELNHLIVIDEDYSYTVDTTLADEFFTDITYEYDNVSYTTSKRTQETFYADEMEDDFSQKVDSKEYDISLDMRYEKDVTNLVQKQYGVKDTYVEVNIGTQHMWFYKDGVLVMHSPVVTGNVSEGHDTPTGTYTITEKLEDKTLNGASVGFDYSIPVDYWLRITDSGIGFHDGTWNTDEEFGSDKYLTNGSHGCINMPLGSVATMYNNIELGTVVYITE